MRYGSIRTGCKSGKSEPEYRTMTAWISWVKWLLSHVIAVIGLFALLAGCSNGNEQESARADDTAGRAIQVLPATPVSQRAATGTNGLADKLAPAVSFHVVTSNSLPGGRFIDTPKFPKLGFIAQRPTMVISNWQNVRIEQRPTDSNPPGKLFVLRLTATAPDAIEIANLTRTNLLRTILISIDEEPLMAPRIGAVIESGEVEIHSTNRVDVETLRSRLIQVNRGPVRTDE